MLTHPLVIATITMVALTVLITTALAVWTWRLCGSIRPRIGRIGVAAIIVTATAGGGAVALLSAHLART